MRRYIDEPCFLLQRIQCHISIPVNPTDTQMDPADKIGKEKEHKITNNVFYSMADYREELHRLDSIPPIKET